MSTERQTDRPVEAETVRRGPPGNGPGQRGSGFLVGQVLLDRYELLEQLGMGGMGIVYRAHDRDHDGEVALKTVAHSGANELFQLKHEFRVLSRINHPNVVRLHELVSDGTTCFFTMDLVEGRTFTEYVREDLPLSAGSSAAPSPSAIERLRAALPGLVDGVRAIHHAERLHRDLKPSNVMVTEGGRVVVLDFGLTMPASFDPLDPAAYSRHDVVGTPGYIAPETYQGTTTEASDWYAVGQMLYEALTGKAPLELATTRVVSKEPTGQSTGRPGDLVDGVPKDLDDLCASLLEREPNARPMGRKIRAGVGRSQGPSVRDHVTPAPRAPFVGRTRERSILEGAYADSRSATVICWLHGSSGIGKSTLLSKLGEWIATQDEAVLLGGRCREQESMPYKAVDGVIEGLAGHLASLSDAKLAPLLPRDASALGRVFPSLGRIRAVAQAKHRGVAPSDRQEVRRLAFDALRELLRRLGSVRGVALLIDDLQWGDVDSADLLRHLLQPPDPPPLLLVGSYRTESAARSPCLGRLLDSAEGAPWPSEPRRIELEQLSSNDSQHLSRALLGRAKEDHAHRVAQESDGNPYFLHELARHFRETGTPEAGPTTRRLTLEEALLVRMDRLPKDARRILEIVAMCGQPIQRAHAWEAAGLGTDVAFTSSRLRQDHLLRGTGRTELDLLEPYHDRIREVVVKHLTDAARTEYHQLLGPILEKADRYEPEIVAEHFAGAGDSMRAREHFLRAADQAARTLAFDTASRLYTRALEVHTAHDDADRIVRVSRGESLANAGRGLDAAEAFLEAARSARLDQSIELRTRAAYQYSVSGMVVEALDTLREVFPDAGLRYPRSGAGTIAALLATRARLHLRGFSHTPRDADRVPPRLLARCDLTFAACPILTDFAQTALFAALNLRFALDSGEPRRVVTALSGEAYVQAARGGRRGGPACERALTAVRSLAANSSDALVHGHAGLGNGASLYFQGHWRRSIPALEDTDEIFRTRCTGVAFELDMVRTMRLAALTQMGEFDMMAETALPLLRDALARGDRRAATHFGISPVPIVLLARGDPDAARETVERHIDRWKTPSFSMQHWIALGTQIYIDFFRQDFASARDRMNESWPRIVRSSMLRAEFFRIYAHHYRGQTAAAAASLDERDRSHCLRVARQSAKALEAPNVPWARAMGRALRASIASATGDRARASTAFLAAAKQFRSCDMGGYAAAAARRAGELAGGSEGESRVQQADQWFRAHGARDPASMASAFVPRI